MDNQTNEAIFAALEQTLDEYGLAYQRQDAGGLEMLKVRLDDLGHAEGTALMEICMLPMGQNPEGSTRKLLQFFTTVAAGLDESNTAPALAALNQVNLRCPVGAFHLYTPQKQMYHKYSLALDASSGWAAQAVTAMTAVVEVIDHLFDEVIIIADDAANWKGPV